MSPPISDSAESSELSTGNISDQIVAGEDAVAAQAERVLGRRRRKQFGTVKACLRLRLEHALPLPDALQADSLGRSSEATPSDSRTADVSETPADPFLLSAGATERQSDTERISDVRENSETERLSATRECSGAVMVMLVTDSEYESTN
jgi:hypothetical protein